MQRLCIAIGFGVLVTGAASASLPAQGLSPRWFDTWDACVAAAKADTKPVFLLVTAPQWDPGSRVFQEKVLSHPDVLKVVDQNYKSYRIDITLKEDKKVPPGVQQRNRLLIQRLQMYGHQGLPRVILLDQDERIYARTGPVGTHEDFLNSLEEWEDARRATIGPVTGAEESARYCNDATAARNLKNPVKALESARKAIYANPQSPLAHFTCGLAYMDQGQLDRARKCYLAALSLDSTGNPDQGSSTIWAAGGWYNLAVAALNAKREQEAVFFLRENLRTDRHTDAPALHIADLHRAAARQDLALEEYGELLSRSGFNPDWLATYLDVQALVFKGK